MRKIIITIIAFCFLQQVFGQTKNIAKCWLWKPKEGHEQDFESGYNKHFSWHKKNGDNPVWYCWQFVSGPRYGQFLDVSFNSWKDFDVSFKPDEDNKDYQLHIVPFAELQTSFKLALLQDFSSKDSVGLHSKYIRLITMTVNDIPNALKVIAKLKENYSSNSSVKNFFTYEMIDGGRIDQILLMLGFNSYSDFGRSENLQEDINVIENSLKLKVITATTSETLSYRPDLFIISQ
jgi:hypothetical protein